MGNKSQVHEDYRTTVAESAAWLDGELGITPKPTATMPSMRGILGEGGIIARHLSGYEPREEQIRMAELVSAAIGAEEHCLVEGGTGVGKSLAYLIPAVYSRRKTVVSTGDKALQDQLWRKDIPFLKSVLPIDFKAAILKGRANYVCQEKLNQEAAVQQNIGQTHEFAEVMAWLKDSESGDLDELPFSLTSELAGNVTSTADGCTGKHCASYEDCYAEKAKAAADRADIVIVNHTLLTLDAALRAKSDDYAKVVPDRELVIIDEAHRLEDAATSAFQAEVSVFGVSRLLHDKQITAVNPDLGKIASIEDAAQAFFDSLAKLSNQQSYSIGEPPNALRLQAENLAIKLKDFAREVERKGVGGAVSDGDEGIGRVEAFKKHLQRIHDYANTITDVLFPDPAQVIYAEKVQGKRRQTVYLRKCPITVMSSLRESLFAKWPVVCTSATLSTGGTFDYFKDRCGCDEARTLIVDSPFDYPHNALVYMPARGADFDPTRFYQEGSPEYFDRLANEIEKLLLASDGRAFCLFTSNKALNEVYSRIANRLRWTVLKQGDKPRQELTRQFIDDGHAVLFGTRSYFEGVDCKGEALSLVVIDKIPFGQPDDPIYKARCDEIVKRTRDKWAWFNQLAIPNATVTLKQGFGRLIRTKTDWGVIALLDGRMSTKNYGSTILRSLPKATPTRSLDAVKTFFETREIVEPQQGRMF